ncbi:DUF5998 family protein [Phycicoccus elongatus]|uniref:DUF5998 family protein n=1 Tax=Phycicoccus elongatus TaxID=101689 RepID=UPI002D21A399|nr:DUF5998 family protein [Phycicoccus elongatus]
MVLAALGGEPVVAHLVHQETTFEHEAIRRHITVLGLTESRLLIVHADDHQDDPHGPVDVATARHERVGAVARRARRHAHACRARPAELCAGILGSRAHAHPRVGGRQAC